MDRQPLTDRLGDRLLAEYGGAAAAYSLRALNGNGDNVVRVRRASDNDEKDFTAEQIELGEMVNWVNSQTVAVDGFVATWYDQSGNGNDATQATTTRQPKIVSSGALVLDNLGNTVVSFDGTDDELLTGAIAQITGDIPHSIFCPFSVTTSSAAFQGAVSIGYGTTGTRVTSAIGKNNSNYWAGGDDLLTPVGSLIALNDLTLLSKTFDGSTISAWENGSALTPVSATFDLGADQNVIAIGSYSTSSRLNAKIPEAIFYLSDQSANRVAIETNINDHYSIY